MPTKEELLAKAERLHADAVRRLRDARASVDVLFRAGLIAPPPD